MESQIPVVNLQNRAVISESTLYFKTEETYKTEMYLPLVTDGLFN